ncbi:penicillin amidase [Algoriphagus ratkowskyi]|uniref:Penicillin acylase family protein n=1 Tax=Algoriphagus ratkowskyi TaxID=57028 RepID=A0A2W7RA04_9BACT|nr:penicillin acylase family protein [Algoriphagus ratkowskyi]PZX57763.1 penicillin amidase [Algoriphagus ratkowskyi]TXD79028.1 penicillin acylase family protein [Algoriphagus ratkowskyi]
MKYIGFFVAFALTIALAVAVSRPFGAIPPLAPLLDPNNGFWQNTFSEDELAEEELELSNLSAEVKVIYDENLIPHVFASNDADLYRAQGYITAKHRLWQMEFQTMAAGGRLSEVVGSLALDLDRMTRRKGLSYGAEKGAEFIKENDPESYLLLEAYADGVNQYIDQLSDARLPVEYKILNYRPEHWSAFKSILLLKYMTDMLVGDRDLEYSNLRKILGEVMLDKLYPEYPQGVDPIIESGHKWGFKSLSVTRPDSISYPDNLLLIDPMPQPEDGTGSNNWAVSGSKTKSGNPILANDPHLSLNLPSLWYSMQLTTPDHSVKGATLPGALGVISGFNEDIAWGVTNATRDTRDWYKITFQDNTRKAYRYGDRWEQTTFRIEEIKVKGEKVFLDTVVYTHYGPVVYDKTFNSNRQDVNFALKWNVHEGSNEQKTFLLLNASKNHEDYNEALNNYTAPAQNFVFASKSGDIAMRIQGKFPLKWRGQGKFFMDGADPRMEWQGYIPNDQNARTLNPSRGFVSSANQHPTDSTYPYYVFDNSFEFYRNRRLNNQLKGMSNITVEDMQGLQFDDYYLHAAEALPIMLGLLGKDSESDAVAKKYLALLNEWDFYADPNQKAPTVFYIWWKKTYAHIWTDLTNNIAPVVLPSYYQTVLFMKNEPTDSIFNLKNTADIETAATHVKQGFKEMLVDMAKWEADEGDFSWANYKRTKIQHLVPQFKSFSVDNVYTGGGSGMLNATSDRAGASWRMVVELGEEIKAFGIYPGGQSGNPGSKYYSNFINKWANGEYLNFDLRKSDQAEGVLFQTILN